MKDDNSEISTSSRRWRNKNNSSDSFADANRRSVHANAKLKQNITERLMLHIKSIIAICINNIGLYKYSYLIFIIDICFAILSSIICRQLLQNLLYLDVVFNAFSSHIVYLLVFTGTCLVHNICMTYIKALCITDINIILKNLLITSFIYFAIYYIHYRFFIAYLILSILLFVCSFAFLVTYRIILLNILNLKQKTLSVSCRRNCILIGTMDSNICYFNNIQSIACNHNNYIYNNENIKLIGMEQNVFDNIIGVINIDNDYRYKFRGVDVWRLDQLNANELTKANVDTVIITDSIVLSGSMMLIIKKLKESRYNVNIADINIKIRNCI